MEDNYNSFDGGAYYTDTTNAPDTGTVVPASTYSTASNTSGNGVSWFSGLLGAITPLTNTAASLYGTLSSNKTAAQLAAERTRTAVASTAQNQSSTMMYVIIGIVVLLVGLLGFRMLRSK